MDVTAAEIVITIIVLVFVASVVMQRMNEVASVRSAVDGRKYIVRNLPDKQRAADMLASMNRDAERLIASMGKDSPRDRGVRRLARNFKPENVSEASDRSGYMTSYTVDKGQKVVLCLRDRDKQDTLHDRNLVMYVFLHELAHIMTKSVGHTGEFWENNQRVLQAAVELGIYKKVDYAKEPASYCGIKLSSSVI